MKNMLRKIIFFGVIATAIFGVQQTVKAAWFESSWGQLEHAAEGTGANLGKPVDPRDIVAQLIKLALSFIGIILFILIIYAGYKWMTAQGNENRITESKQTIFNATIGLIIILSAYAITVLVTNLATGKKLDTQAGQGAGTLDNEVEKWFQ